MVIILKSSDGSGAGTPYGVFESVAEAEKLLDEMFPKPSPGEYSEYWEKIDGDNDRWDWVYYYWYDVMTIEPIEKLD
jgi:hypothetical protein